MLASSASGIPPVEDDLADLQASGSARQIAAVWNRDLRKRAGGQPWLTRWYDLARPCHRKTFPRAISAPPAVQSHPPRSRVPNGSASLTIAPTAVGDLANHRAATESCSAAGRSSTRRGPETAPSCAVTARREKRRAGRRATVGMLGNARSPCRREAMRPRLPDIGASSAWSDSPQPPVGTRPTDPRDPRVSYRWSPGRRLVRSGPGSRSASEATRRHQRPGKLVPAMFASNRGPIGSVEWPTDSWMARKSCDGSTTMS